MFRTVRLLALGALLFLGACAKPQVIQKAQKDDGSTVEMRKGDKLDVALEGNPTSGFSWVIAEGDTTIIAQEGEMQFLPSTDVSGGPGSEALHFGAIGKGKTTLRLQYRRPFETNVDPVRVYTLRVAVD
jgi:inhibitor of cysteine peptidase